MSFIGLKRVDRAATVMCCECAALTCIPGLKDDPEMHAKMRCWVCGKQAMTVRYASVLRGEPRPIDFRNTGEEGHPTSADDGRLTTASSPARHREPVLPRQPELPLETS